MQTTPDPGRTTRTVSRHCSTSLGEEVPGKNTSPPQHASPHAVMRLAFPSHRQPPISSLLRTQSRSAYSRKPSLPALYPSALAGQAPPLCHCPHRAKPQYQGGNGQQGVTRKSEGSGDHLGLHSPLRETLRGLLATLKSPFSSSRKWKGRHP